MELLPQPRALYKTVYDIAELKVYVYSKMNCLIWHTPKNIDYDTFAKVFLLDDCLSLIDEIVFTHLHLHCTFA